eukprot:4121593-Amphidinium_carterae.1
MRFAWSCSKCHCAIATTVLFSSTSSSVPSLAAVSMTHAAATSAAAATTTTTASRPTTSRPTTTARSSTMDESSSGEECLDEMADRRVVLMLVRRRCWFAGEVSPRFQGDREVVLAVAVGRHLRCATQASRTCDQDHAT